MRLMVLARRHSRAQVILRGPGPAAEEVLRRAPELEGRLVIDRRARNTFENAFYSLGLAQPGPQERWLVVTSESICPGQWAHSVPLGSRSNPGGFATRHAPMIQHEVLGLIYYRLVRRTQAVLPSAPL